MNDPVSLLTCAALVMSLICILIFGYANYKDYYHKKINFLQTFPYEMGDQPKMKITNFLRLVIALFVVSATMLQVHLLGSISLFSHISLMIVGSLASMSIATLFLIPMRNIKLHIGFFSISYTFTILSFIHFAYFLKTTPFFIPGAEIYFWISLLFIALQIGLLFSSHLKKWYVLERVEEENEVKYVRPKVLYIALLEWLNLIFYLVYLLLLILSRTF